jgi:hypothetical protein
VPLGSAYLELVAVVDQAEAAQSPFGRWVAHASSSVATPLGWAVRTERLDEVARRLGLDVAAGSRERGGHALHWRLAGIEQAAAEPSLPFFIEWERGTRLPGRTPAAHRAVGVTIAELQLAGDAGRIAAWLGGQRLPIVVDPGPPGVTSVVLAGAAGEIVLGPLRPAGGWRAASASERRASRRRA